MPKTIVVTGTDSGIGRATVNKFAAEGWNVVATVRKESDLRRSRSKRVFLPELVDMTYRNAVPIFR